MNVEQNVETSGGRNFSRHLDQVCLYWKTVGHKQLKLVSMDMEAHGVFMHNWANQFYASKFWQMNGDFESFYTYYKNKLKLNEETLLIAYLNDIPIGQLEIYPVKSSELATHFNAGGHDLGVHVLLAPHRTLLKEFGPAAKGLNVEVLQAALEYMFYTANAQSVLAEPDMLNKNACKLAEKVGFSYLKNIQLPDKKASLFIYRRNTFLEKYPKPADKQDFLHFKDNA